MLLNTIKRRITRCWEIKKTVQSSKKKLLFLCKKQLSQYKIGLLANYEGIKCVPVFLASMDIWWKSSMKTVKSIKYERTVEMHVN